MKLGDLTYCGWFKNQNGHLALKETSRLDKFCVYYGDKMPISITELGPYIKRQYKHHMTNFLAHDNLPANSKFENFEEFLDDS